MRAKQKKRAPRFDEFRPQRRHHQTDTTLRVLHAGHRQSPPVEVATRIDNTSTPRLLRKLADYMEANSISGVGALNMYVDAESREDVLLAYFEP